MPANSFKAKEAADRYYKRQIEETARKNAEYAVWVADNPNNCVVLREVLKNLKSFKQ